MLITTYEFNVFWGEPAELLQVLFADLISGEPQLGGLLDGSTAEDSIR